MPSPGERLLSARGVDVDLARHPVLRDVSLHIGAGETVAAIAPRGAAASLLAICIPLMFRVAVLLPDHRY